MGINVIGRTCFKGSGGWTRTAAVLAAVVACTAMGARAASISLGTAENFAVLGAAAVTNTGTSSITGDVGVAPGTSITGLSPSMVTGTIHNDDAVAQEAQADALSAYNTLSGMPVTRDLTGQDLGGLVLTSGVYHFDSTAGLTGTLTLSGPGQFVFQIGSALTTASDSAIDLIGGADADDVFFQVGSSATLGTGTAFEGTLIASASDTLTTGATVDGRVIALTGAVTLDTNTITRSIAVPLPASAYTGLMALAGLAAFRYRRPMAHRA